MADVITTTYLDLANTLGPDNKVAPIIEVLAETNEVLDDMSVREGNLPTGHKSVIRTGLPSVAWRILNYGVQPSKGTTRPVVDTTGMLEAYAQVDKEIADLNGNTSAFRLSEDRAFLEAMNQAHAEALFYGNESVDPEQFTGLAPRYSTLSSDPLESGYNIIDAGGTGANQNTSIWLVVWGEMVHGIYPKGSMGGFKHEDKGQVTLTDDAGGLFEGYRSHYQWKTGLVVKDWKYVVRIANIDWADTCEGGAGGEGADLVDVMIDALEIIPSLRMGTPVFYMRREVRTALRKQIRTDGNVNLTFDTVAGKRVAMFDEVKVARVDQLLSTEDRIQ